jgi:hypothetical protein
MKKFFENQIKGLIWFVLAYALVRVFLSNPEMATQGKDLFSIFLAVLAFVWVIFPKIMGEANLPLSISFLSMSGYSLFTWTKFDPGIFAVGWFQDLNDDKIALLTVLLIFILSAIIFMTDLVSACRETKKRQDILWLVPAWLIFITAIIAAGDYLLPTLIPW